MRIKKAIEKFPGGLMVVPLMLGALLNTIDSAHFGWIQAVLKWLGAQPTKEGFYEFLRIGGFTQALFKEGALCLIGLFLFCAGSQMTVRVAGKALKKGLLITGSKYATGVVVGYVLGRFFGPYEGLLGLSTMAIIAAMTNSNGGMYAALTGQYGSRSDVGAVAILSLNDGPFFTLVALGMLGQRFPAIAFIAVLLPIALGMLLGNLDEDLREFLKPGTSLTIPFFAFALGAGMNFLNFLKPEAVGGGLLLGLMTVTLSAASGILVLKLLGERSQICAVAEASTAGNAAATPAAIAAAALLAREAGMMSAEVAQHYQDIMNRATVQISISTLSTALLCPAAVILWDRYQRSKGIDGRLDEEAGPAGAKDG